MDRQTQTDRWTDTQTDRQTQLKLLPTAYADGKNDSFTHFNLLILCMWLQVINKIKVTHQGEGHIKVKVKLSSSLPTLCKILLILTY